MMEEEVFTFRDAKPNPGIYHTYDDTLRSSKVPIVLDHGNIFNMLEWYISYILIYV